MAAREENYMVGGEEYVIILVKEVGRAHALQLTSSPKEPSPFRTERRPALTPPKGMIAL
ncbi:MAG: hypothetical protein JCHSAcid_05130 [uncultured Acidilobus sp. JCHS]|nr:MAG: hypothetical protein JCHSAcid_05130 [uncultured Acidilobus sp. JCHS]